MTSLIEEKHLWLAVSTLTDAQHLHVHVHGDLHLHLPSLVVSDNQIPHLLVSPSHFIPEPNCRDAFESLTCAMLT